MKTIQALPPLERRVLFGILATFALLGALYNPHIAAGEITPDRSNPNLMAHCPGR